MNLDPTFYVRLVRFSREISDLLTCAIPKGSDAHVFSPDRFIDVDGNLIPPLPETKDGASVV